MNYNILQNSFEKTDQLSTQISASKKSSGDNDRRVYNIN